MLTRSRRSALQWSARRSARSSFPAIPFGAYPSPIPIASGPTSGAFRKSVHALLYQRYYSQFAAGWAHSFEIPRKRYQTALPVEHFFVCCLQLARAFHLIFLGAPPLPKRAIAHPFRHTLCTGIPVSGGTIENAANTLSDNPAMIR